MTLYRAVRTVVAPILRLVWRLEVVGAENMPAGPAIVVANHDSLSDPFFLGAALERPLHFLAKRELWANRVVGRLLDGLGGIPVERRRGDLTAVAALARVLERGDVVAIFPQGTVLGVETSPLAFTRTGESWSVTAADRVRMSAQGANGLNPAAPPLQLTHTGHPAADTFSLARAADSHVSVFGVSWHDTSGRNNGQYAPFAWRDG